MEVGNEGGAQWVQLSNIFEARAVSQDKATIISEAKKKMVDSGLIDDKNKLEFLSSYR